MTMPKQKPGRSKQNYGTPPALLTAILQRLYIPRFSLDVAADANNAVASNWYTEADDGLTRPWQRMSGWNWCNPPYANIRDWVDKALEETRHGAHSCVLIPASVGSEWWQDYVEFHCYQLFLTPRLTFVGCTDPYPKDCALLLYTPFRFKGNEVWRWKTE